MASHKTTLLNNLREMIANKELPKHRAASMIDALYAVTNEGWTFTATEVELSLPEKWTSPQANKKRKEPIDVDIDEESRPHGDPVGHYPSKTINYKDTVKKPEIYVDIKAKDTLDELRAQVKHYLDQDRPQKLILSPDSRQNPITSPQRALRYGLWLLDAHEATMQGVNNIFIPYKHKHVRVKEGKPNPQKIEMKYVPEGYQLTELKDWPFAAIIAPYSLRYKHWNYNDTTFNGYPAASFPLLIEFAHAHGNNGNGTTLTTYTVIHPATRVMMPCDNRNITTISSTSEKAKHPTNNHYFYTFGQTIMQHAQFGDPNQELGDIPFISAKIGCKIFPVTTNPNPTTCEGRKKLHIQVMYALHPVDTRKQPAN